MIEQALKQRKQGLAQKGKKTKKAEDQEKSEGTMMLDTELKELPPVQAMRAAFLYKYGSLRCVWRYLDGNGSGSLSFTEFEEGIEGSGLNWKTITGCVSMKELFNLFDSDGSNDVSLLGFPGVEEGPADSSHMTIDNAWKRYVNATKLSPMACAREARWKTMMPLQYELII